MIPSQDDRYVRVPAAGQLPRHLRGPGNDAMPLLELVPPVAAPMDAADFPDDPAEPPVVLADRYLSAEPIDWQGATVYPMYSEQLSTPASALTMTLLSATPPARPAGVGIGLSVIGGYIDIDGKHLAGVDIWRDALERGITFDLTADSPDALFALTPVWSDATGEPQSWVGNYGVVVEQTDSGRTVLWCSVGEGPPHFADLVVEIRSIPLDPHPRLFTPRIPAISAPGDAALYQRDSARSASGTGAVDGGFGDIVPEPGNPAETAGHSDESDPAATAVRPPGIAEVEGYPCSFADLFLLSRDPQRGTDFPRYTRDLPAVATSDLDLGLRDFGGYEEWPAEWDGGYDETWYDDGGTADDYQRFPGGPSAYGTAGPAGWAENPEQTGLVPVIRDAGLPDYGHEPPRPAASSDRAALVADHLPAAPRHRSDDSFDMTDALADTVADGSLPPVPAGKPTSATDLADPDRLHTLGGAAHALGNDEQAVRLWAPAARAGHIGAAYDLGLLYLRREEPEAAEVWWRAAAARRLIPAMSGLADLLERRGAGAEARMWRAQAVAEEVIATAIHPGIGAVGGD
ncbi:hypothetical protein [Nocardia sp. NPDC024068]|uniref:hypothetical protein n=1 Tax=Nocardia sp. NPDC024068 TaxID=3157197 RepID=UPI00340DF258